MNTYIIDLGKISRTDLDIAGSKAVNLAALYTMENIFVPVGFCITTAAFKSMVARIPQLDKLLDKLAVLRPADNQSVQELCSTIRTLIEEAPVPGTIAHSIREAVVAYGADHTYAVRSSATAEDLPGASFAGQHDTCLNVAGPDAVLEHVRKCWASLFTERAVIYRMQQGFDHRKVYLSVIVQQMIFPQASGIMFTADPVTGHRKILSIDAGFGLGEALVLGMVNADVYQVRDDTIISRKVANKKLAIHALPQGGTAVQQLAPELQQAQVLNDEEIHLLAQTGKHIAAHFGAPQDIEWCLDNGRFYILQSRPITTLFPIPENNDGKNHVYVSVGHQQMMTDAMKPLGISVRQLTTTRPMYTAGGRMFVDVAADLADPAKRHMLVNVLGNSDPLIKSALTQVLDRGDFISLLPDQDTAGIAEKPAHGGFQALNDYGPEVVTELIQRSEAAVEHLKQQLAQLSGLAVFDCIREDIKQLNSLLVAGFGVVMTGMNAAAWLNEKMQEWLGEINVADVLSQSLDNNITSEMGLDLLDMADSIRAYPEVIAYLEQEAHGDFLEDLSNLQGGATVLSALKDFLCKYGMRCAGEIDITRPRWAEDPGALIPVIRNNIWNTEAGERKRKFDRGLEEARRKEEELLGRLQGLPDGARKAAETKRMIGLVRNLAGYREYPKYDIVSRYFIYRQALLKAADKLVQAGVIDAATDIFYLNFEALEDAVRSGYADRQLIEKEKQAFALYEKMSPPRVMTSDGEVINGAYRNESLPARAMAGLAVSSGIVEGRARVVLRLEEARLEEGDILVTAFTDPSWTPLFIAVKGLVTEVGGLMTHGSVIAREYGLPAVVGVDNATKQIRDGQRIRINGTLGYVELL